jgi:lysophospholipase L1-like esterase
MPAGAGGELHVIRWLATFAIATLSLLACGCGTTTSAPATPAGTVIPNEANQPTAIPGYIVAALGDSIAGAPGTVCAGCTPYVDRYADALAASTGKAVDVQNVARPSLRVERLLQDLMEGSAASDAAAAADAIIVAVGTSDAPWNITDDACDGSATAVDFVPWDRYTEECISAHVERFRPTFDGVFKRLVELRAGRPTVYRALDLYNDWIGFEGDVPPAAVETSVNYLDAWNAMVCETAESNGFACAPISAAFNGEDGRTASGDLLAPDYVHPSDKGHQRMAEVLVDLGFAPLLP